MTSPIENLTVPRAEWQALPPKEAVPALSKPVAHVMFHATGTETCSNKSDCEQAVLQLQQQHIDQGLADIKYNFLVGGDGKLYEGRGWHTRPGKSEMYPYIQDSSIDIAFFGKRGVRPPKEETAVSKALMKYAVEKRLVTENPIFFADI